jgi:hypothetical protein
LSLGAFLQTLPRNLAFIIELGFVAEAPTLLFEDLNLYFFSV